MAKQKTFEQARQGIFVEALRRRYTLKTGLKTPHATSPSGNFRLWFKPQVVHFTEGLRHEAGDASRGPFVPQLALETQGIEILPHGIS